MLIFYYKKVIGLVKNGCAESNTIMGYMYLKVMDDDVFIYFSEIIVNELENVINTSNYELDFKKLEKAYTLFAHQYKK